MINSNNFNAFDINQATNGNALYFMLRYMYIKYDFGENCNISEEKWTNLSRKLQVTYRDTKYHN